MRRFVGLICVVFVTAAGLSDRASGQSSVSFLGQRVFLTGLTPIIGPRGGVGGIEVDADGVLSRVEMDEGPRLGRERTEALRGISQDVRRDSPMRKVSLRLLEAEISEQLSKNKSLSADLLLLAGLQRVQFVFVYPQHHDIILAGPADGSVFRDRPDAGASALRLDDLLDALQGTAAAADGEDGISWSIDPSPDGMARVARMLQSNKVTYSETVLKRMEQQLGPQNVTITGVRPDGHFARVMVGADYMMKRIAMGLDRSPTADVPSYLQLMKDAPARKQLTAPRWWIATDYPTAERSADGLAWHFAGRGVKVMSEHGYLNGRGELVNAGRATPLAQRWADLFTDHYDQFAAEIPAFDQLQGCVDLALVAALITQESLLEVADCPLELMTDSEKLLGVEYPVPKQVPSLASALKGRSGWVVSVSGGVDIDTWTSIAGVNVNAALSELHRRHAKEPASWWWD